jgi:hypothetical protein
LAALFSVGVAVSAASIALAAGVPTVTTGTASQLSATSAQVGATVNPNGEATTYTFKYGATASYGSQTPTASVGSGTSDTPVHATISGLSSNTTYHYTVSAASSAGNATGSDGTFTTLATPPTVTLSSPSVVTSSSANLAGSVNPRGKATTYSFQYGPTTAYGLQSPVTSAGSGTSTTHVHASIGGLLAGTTYHYRIVAISSDGTSSSPDGTLTTTGDQANPGGTLPAISQSAAVAIGANSVQLNGAVNPEGPTTTWYFQYGLSGYYGLETSPQKLSGFGARPVSSHLSGLQSSATYHYRLVAFSANGLYVGPDHTFTTKTVGRSYARRFSTSVYAHRSHTGVTVTTSGYLSLPSSMTRSSACRGAVAVQIKAGHQTISLKRVFVRSGCRFSAHSVISRARLHSASRLSVSVRFEGNQVLMPATAVHIVHI